MSLNNFSVYALVQAIKNVVYSIVNTTVLRSDYHYEVELVFPFIIETCFTLLTLDESSALSREGHS